MSTDRIDSKIPTSENRHFYVTTRGSVPPIVTPMMKPSGTAGIVEEIEIEKMVEHLLKSLDEFDTSELLWED